MFTTFICIKSHSQKTFQSTGVQCEHEFCYGCDASFRTGDVSDLNILNDA